MTLNERSLACFDKLAANAGKYRVQPHDVAGARVIDCGGAAVGGLEAGLMLARICMADLADVEIEPGPDGPLVQVFTDDPIRACLASQYAGWQVKVGSYFAMGSGPMRAAYGKEAIFEEIAGKEEPPVAVGVLETKKHPTEEVVAYLVQKLPTSVQKLCLAVAPTGSMAGTIQVTARALETALHKLHELEFDMSQVLSGHGVAPLPPIAASDIQGIGWTNDAILYGGRVTLWVRADDEIIDHIGPKVASCASKDYGRPFAELFKEVGGDFYKIDPMLFSPAEITFHNLKTGKTHRFGKIDPELLRRSFGG